ncbi:MAG: hypothetical protein HY336_00590 [Candidatus Doudnabacteria bacterium]|nr:hypothetical protein [Candidatus Doudnabacteria bacterium]
MSSSKIKWFFLVLLLVWLGVFFSQKINLTTADLGRHIKNGEIAYQSLLNSDYSEFKKILETNYYSYTNPDFPVFNHHWGSGLVFYSLHQLGGFTLLSIFGLLTTLSSFLLIFDVSRKLAGFWPAWISAVFLIPLIGERQEIRPEMFSYLFTAAFLWILSEHKTNPKRKYLLYFLPPLLLLWANLHIYFFLGFLLIGIYAIMALTKRPLFLTAAGGLVLSLANPFGYKALAYPLQIFQNYGYTIVENKSVWFLTNFGFSNPNLTLIKIITAVFLIMLVLAIRKRKSYIDHSPEFLAIAAIFLVMAWLAFRNFSLFGFFALPFLSAGTGNFLAPKFLKFEPEEKYLSLAGIGVATIILIYIYSYRLANFGFGLVAQADSSADFFKSQDVKGPIFNNYDIGSFLIYHLPNQQKVFVDNRPEAYPAEFFEKTYIPMQEKDEIWKQQADKYGFNSIYFAINDLTNWGQNFLTSRVKDPNWVAVYADSFSIIFVKRKEENKQLIEKFEIPKNNFNIIQP